jgi:hypothetical protein
VIENRGVPASPSGHSPEVEPSVPLSPAKPSVPNAVTIPRDLYNFLMGVGQIDGTWFNDLNANLPGRYWWRALLQIAALPDSEIDTSDIPETLDWSGAERGRFTAQAIEARRAIDSEAGVVGDESAVPKECAQTPSAKGRSE